MGGMNDSDADKVCIYGDSNETSNLMTLEDMYESFVPTPEPSRYHWNNGIIKAPKYSSHFPEERRFAASATLSTSVSEAGEYPGVYLGGATSQSGMVLLPEPANVMCGHLEIDAWMIADDTATQVEDSATLLITIWVESWKSLVYPRKRSGAKRGRKSSRKTSSARNRSKTSRKSRR